MRTLVLSVIVLATVLAGQPTRAEIGVIDAVPAATLLLPYFEVDLVNPDGITTLMSINNASASAAVAHVTLWSDWGIPTFNFDIYLTGYDVQTINLRDIFNGLLPLTADAGADPGDSRSNKGLLSQDINFPGSTGPCGFAATLYDAPDPSLAAKINHLRQAHTGLPSPILGGLCAGTSFGDSLARGYVTVDTVTQCNLEFPSDPGYFAGVADFRNLLWGDYFLVDSAQNFAQGDALVHIESCVPGNGFLGYVGNGAGHCPLVPGDYSFYARYVAGSALDQREPLASTFASRYLNGGAFTGGTDLLVWRDTKVTPNGVNGPRACGTTPNWYPLGQTGVVAFDEQENATDLCTATACFPPAAGRIPTNGPFPPTGTSLGLTAPFGWLFLNLNTSVAGDASGNPGVSQGWVTPVFDADGRFSVGLRATPLDTLLP